MKVSDDYSAKIALWIKNAKVHPLPKMEGLPLFRSKKFNSYEEMNPWKKELLQKIAKQGGVKWTN
jgi:hypothetical protein